MNMFCYQCQETAKSEGCTINGVCGKTFETANLQDLLVYSLKGLAHVNQKAREFGINSSQAKSFLVKALFSTITNANFNRVDFTKFINEAISLRDELKSELMEKGFSFDETSHDSIRWHGSENVFQEKAKTVSPMATENADVRSLRELLIYGIKGIAAYYQHADVLDYKNDEIVSFMERALIATTNDSLSGDDLTAMVLDAGKYGVSVMALLDEANTKTYGHPEITKVNIGTRNNPGILISGHDLKDMEMLLEQSKDSGVDVYTHSEMLPANYYPKFKKYGHFVGNYGNAWWKQKEEFESFKGPILMTTNCIVPPKDSYKDRLFTTGVAGFEGIKHISDNKKGKKDFSEIIELAKKCEAPKQIEEGEIIGGFAHNQVLELADKVVEAVKSGAIKKFVVMAGCDGRQKGRDYYSEFAQKLPKDTVILTAGCAKYRYNKLNLGDIGGIPRVLDAGQCNDSYSLAVTALKLKEVFELNDINDLPVVYNIAWYEQKAVIVLLALLHLGVKNIKLGPTLPAFLSRNVANVLVENFGISGISDVDSDIKEMIL
ncbi:MAG: hydroxylamine reductase [Pseudomonadota bacterium]